MKKLICLIMSLLLVCSFASPFKTALAEENNILISPAVSPLYEVTDSGEYIFDGDYIISLWKELENNFPDRTDGEEGEKAAALYLASFLETFGYDTKDGSYLQNFSVYNEDSVDSGYLIHSQNVIGVKKASVDTAKTVVIGAHYDNAFGLSNSLSHGSYDNGSGVSCLLAIAAAVASSDLPYNVEIVFFGMEEMGMLGSEAYVSKLSEEDIENVLMMINLDSVSCGDYLYIFTDEVKRSHEEMFMESAEKLGGGLTEMPWDKKLNGYFRVIDEKPFVHIGIQSDNAVFMAKGIPCTAFIGYNLSSKENINGQESDGKLDIMHTVNDNYSSILDIYGEDFVKGRFELLCGTVMTTLTRSDFVENAEYSKENPTTVNFIYSTWFFFAISIVVFVAFIVAVYIISKKDWGKLPTIKIIISQRAKEINTFEENDDDGDVFD